MNVPWTRLVGLGLVVVLVAATAGAALASWQETTQLRASASAAYRPPLLLRAPHVSGSAVDTRTLTAVDGEWARLAPNATRVRQWWRCSSTCAALANETNQTYTVPAGTVDSGARYVVRETITNGTEPANAVSLPTIVHTKGSVAIGLLTYAVVNVTPPAVSPPTAPPAVSSTVTASDGTWDAMSLLNLGSLLGLDFQAISRQWLRCGPVGNTAATTVGTDGCTPIAGATGASYVVTSADRDNRLRIRVTLSGRPLLGSNSTGTVDSQATGVVP